MMGVVDSSTSADDRNLGRYLTGVAAALTQRYDRRGSLEDLEAAIDYAQRAVHAEVLGTHRHRISLDGLGGLYRRRFLRFGDPPDILRSVQLLGRAVEEAQGSMEFPYRLSNFGNALLEKFAVTGDPNDLAAAVESEREAVRLTEPGDWWLASRLNNLGNALSVRFDGGGSVEDLEEATRVYHRSVELTSPNDPMLTSRLYNLGNTLRRCYQHTQTHSYLEESITSYRRACTSGADFSLEWTVAASAAWGVWAGCRESWEEASEAFRHGLKAIESLYRSQLLPGNRNVWLKDYRNLANQAAYALAKIGCLTEAVLTLEANRTRALAEALSMRAASVEAAKPEDRKEWLRLRERISELQSEAVPSAGRAQRDLLDVAMELRKAHEALEATARRIRAYLPEFLPAGLGATEIDALSAKLERPLTYLLTVQQGSLALIVQPSTVCGSSCELTIVAVWLPEFTENALHSVLFGRDGRNGYLEAAVLGGTPMLSDVLAEVWPMLNEQLIAPLARVVAERGQRGAVLVPTGMLSLLPLHGDQLGGCVLSSTPSARALQSAVGTLGQLGALPRRFIGIGNPLPQASPLAFAAAEIESIAAHFPKNARQNLSEERATLRNIQAAVTSASEQRREALYVHLACHGAFDPQEPLDSSIFFSGNDQMTLRALLHGELNLSTARLVTLSACQTGVTEFRQVPDEAIGLPSGVMQAGAPGVISTLWPVDDVSTAVLMARFYELHLHANEQLNPAAALHHAQAWLQASTAAELDLATWFERRLESSRGSDSDAFKWMTYYRENPHVKPFENPYFWGGFFFTGL